MALPVSATAFYRAARRGWPLIVAALLTLMLGWAALQENDYAAGGPSGGLTQQAQAPAPDGMPLEQALLRADTQPDAGRGGKLPPLPARFATGDAPPRARAAVSLPAALPSPRPSLRQPPGQAPPAHA